MKISGTVIHGKKMGSRLGFPTANIAVPDSFEAENGVYAAIVEFDGERRGAMANLGVRPSFPGRRGRFLELHLFDFDGDLYGREVTAELLEFLRPERKFPNSRALRTQIERDKFEIEIILTLASLRCSKKS